MQYAEKTAPTIGTTVATEHFPIKEKAKTYGRVHPDSDAVAILVHGFTGSPYDMKELADFLYENSIDSYVVRLAGHGSNIKDLMRMHYADWFNSVAQAVVEVEKTGKRIFLVGYSFGANIILDIASRNPDRYQGIVCLGTSIFWKSRFYYSVLYHFFKLFGIEKVRKPYVPKYRVESFEAPGNYSEFPTTGLGEFRDIVLHYTPKLLHNVTTPALIIHSRDDRISHPRSSDYLFEHIGSSYKEMFVLRELNHNPLRSENKNKIFERVVQFIQS